MNWQRTKSGGIETLISSEKTIPTIERAEMWSATGYAPGCFWEELYMPHASDSFLGSYRKNSQNLGAKEKGKGNNGKKLRISSSSQCNALLPRDRQPAPYAIAGGISANLKTQFGPS
jgi:hypothetical protein